MSGNVYSEESLDMFAVEVKNDAGEILPQNEGVLDIKVEGIPKILGWMLSLEKHLNHLKNPRPEEPGNPNSCFCAECNLARTALKYKALIARKQELLENRHGELLSQSERLVIETGEECIKYPGLGTIGYYKSQRKVHTKGWDELSHDEKRSIFQQYPMYFRVDNELHPAKKIISEGLKDDANFPLTSLFSLAPETVRMDFRKER